MPRTEPIHELPPGYREVKLLVATEHRTLVWLNLLALPLMGAGLGLMVMWAALVRVIGGPYPLLPADSLPSWVLWVFVVAVFPLHEWLHGLAIRRVGHRPRYGAITAPLGKGLKIPLALYATADSALFRREEFIMVALAPLAGITLAGMAGMLFLPGSLGIYIVVAVAVNAGGAVGDLWMVAAVLRHPASVLVRDEADRIRIYARRPA